MSDFIVSLDTLIIFALLLLYVIGGSFMEHKKFPLGHETSIALIAGLLISFALKFANNGHSYDIQFDGKIFFYVCLPPIIFASGFNMRRKRFFDNIGYILVFGIFGTLITFFVFTGMTYGFLSTGSIMMKTDQGEKVLSMSLQECFLISSLLCSSDVIAAISIIKYEEQPKLFSLVFGEGIVNDAVAIILFNTVSNTILSNAGVSVSTPLQIVGEFLALSVGSLLIGVVSGLLASYILKKMRFITVSSVKETLLVFCFGYVAYSTGELAHMSGIISMLTSGVIMAHYGWYNLSPQGKHVSCVAFQVIGFGFEAFVFAYLGLSFFSYMDLNHMTYAWSWQFILIELMICIIARFLGTVGLVYVLVLFRHKKLVTFKQLLFICYAGLIRGAIAFGLVLKLDNTLVTDPYILQVITTTALTLVISTTIVFGSTMPFIQNKLVPPKEDEAHEYDEVESMQGLMGDHTDTEGNEGKKKINNSNSQDVKHTEHEEFIHPNAMRNSEYITNEQPGEKLSKSEFVKMRRKKFNSCAACFKRFDDLIMRPLLIYNFEAELLSKKEDFLELFMKEGDLWEKLYAKEEYNAVEVEDMRSQRGYSVFHRIEQQSRRNSNFRGLRNSGMSVRSGQNERLLPHNAPQPAANNYLPTIKSPQVTSGSRMLTRGERSVSHQYTSRKMGGLPGSHRNENGYIGMVVEEPQAEAAADVEIAKDVNENNE